MDDFKFQCTVSAGNYHADHGTYYLNICLQRSGMWITKQQIILIVFKPNPEYKKVTHQFSPLPSLVHILLKSAVAEQFKKKKKKK